MASVWFLKSYVDFSFSLGSQTRCFSSDFWDGGGPVVNLNVAGSESFPILIPQPVPQLTIFDLNTSIFFRRHFSSVRVYLPVTSHSASFHFTLLSSALHRCSFSHTIFWLFFSFCTSPSAFLNSTQFCLHLQVSGATTNMPGLPSPDRCWCSSGAITSIFSTLHLPFFTWFNPGFYWPDRFSAGCFGYSQVVSIP